jgi:hypothetical protein
MIVYRVVFITQTADHRPEKASYILGQPLCHLPPVIIKNHSPVNNVTLELLLLLLAISAINININSTSYLLALVVTSNSYVHTYF